MVKNKKLFIYRIVLIAAIALSLAFIYGNSLKTGEKSSVTSTKVTEAVATVIVPDFKNLPEAARQQKIKEIHAPLREVAHSLEFCMLAFFVCLLYSSFGGKIFGKFYFAVLFSLGSCFLIALSDEFLQTFIPGRGAEWLDIGMDSLGALTGSLIAILVVFIYKKITAKNSAQLT